MNHMIEPESQRGVGPRARAATSLLLLTILGLLSGLAACTLPAADGSPVLDRSANFTQAAQTLDAQLTLAAAGAFPTVTPLGTQTGTAIPIITPTSAGQAGGQTTPDPAAPCDRGAFVADVSVPDGTVFEPGQTFVKTWRLQNSGSCTWTPDYAVVFDSGDAMSGPASFPLTQSSVSPGGEIEVSINLIAPAEPGSYRGDWRLRNPAGQSFGLGTQGTASFWVDIIVAEKAEAALSFDQIHDCDGVPTAIFELVNTGDAGLESVQITLTNQDSGQTIFGPFSSDGPFLSSPGECPPGGDTAEPGSTMYLGGSLAGSNASGETIEAAITLCTGESLGGTCYETTLEFEIP